MWAYLDLTWKPSATSTTPPAGKAPAIVRNDSYAHTIVVTDGVLNGYDDWTFTAQIRTARLAAGVTAGSAVTDFAVALAPNATDANDLDVILSLTSAQTTDLDLPAGGYWDLQLENAGVITTWLAGKVKVLDDVTRAA